MNTTRLITAILILGKLLFASSAVQAEPSPDEDNLPFIDNYSALDDILSERLKLNFDKKDFHNIKKRNFFKIDKKAYLRFWDLMKRYE